MSTATGNHIIPDEFSNNECPICMEPIAAEKDHVLRCCNKLICRECWNCYRVANEACTHDPFYIRCPYCRQTFHLDYPQYPLPPPVVEDVRSRVQLIVLPMSQALQGSEWRQSQSAQAAPSYGLLAVTFGLPLLGWAALVLQGYLWSI